MRLDWRATWLVALLVSVTVDHWTLTVAGLHVKPEHIVCLGLLGLVAWDVARRHISFERAVDVPSVGAGFKSAPTANAAGFGARNLIPLLVYLSALLAASIVNAPDRGNALKHTALVALVASAAPLVYWLANTPARLRFAVRTMIMLGVLEAAFTFLVLVAAEFGNTLGTQPGFLGTRVPFSTLWEANLLGSYLAAAGMLLLSTILSEPRGRRTIALSACLAVLLSALALSVARAAWIGTLAGLAVVAVGHWIIHRSLRTTHYAGRTTLAALAAFCALVFVVGAAPMLFPGTAQNMRARLDFTYYQPQNDVSVQGRAQTSVLALNGILAHPLIGNGPGSYGNTHSATGNAEGWISNLELHLLYDSGLIGFGGLLVGLGILGAGAWRGLRRPAPLGEDLRPETIGLVGALVSLLAAFQATEGTWLAFTWVYAGLLARAVKRGGDRGGEVRPGDAR